MNDPAMEKAREIAGLVEKKGGRAYFVGGFVRDRLLNIENKDVDVEVHGIEPGELKEILCRLGKPLEYGASFGIMSMSGLDLDIAMPRKERATGNGHRDFQVEVDPFIGPEKAARRRDFTMNAMMEDVLTGEILDFFGGREDLEKGIIRHVDPRTFPEDPLRVLRAAQFAARFCFSIAPETIDLCGVMDLSALSRERVEEELRKALVKGEEPSRFFQALRQMGQLHCWFPELEQLIGLEQDPVFHPEGDVWNHTMDVIDRAAAFRGEVSDPYAFMLLCLTHDLGKITTTQFVKGRIHAYRHETEGAPLVGAFLDRLVSEKKTNSYVMNMVPLHMKPNVASRSHPALKSTNRMFDQASAPEDLIWFAQADAPVRAGTEAFTGDPEFLRERLDQYRQIMDRPWFTGRDLMEKGLEPGADFGEFLAYAHKMRLAGVDRDSALKQTMAYARKERKSRKQQKKQK